MTNCPKCLNEIPAGQDECEPCRDYERWFIETVGHSFGDEIRMLKKKAEDAGLGHLVDDIDDTIYD